MKSDKFNINASIASTSKPSKYWEYLNNKNKNQIKKYGYKNFKRTVSLNYFTWIVSPFDPQIKYLVKMNGVEITLKIFMQTLFSKSHKPMNIFSSWSYTFLTKMLWYYIEKSFNANEVNCLKEPLIGNPPKVYSNGVLISQDLANSYLEYYSIFKSKKINSKIKTVLEVGPGYGRTAYVILSFNNNLKYFFVDINPALDICQKYMETVFPDKKIFKHRVFDNYSDIKKAVDKSDLIFLTPDQMGKLPANSIDLFINISSFHEMKTDQVKYYYSQIERLIKKFVYIKEWKNKIIPFDEIKYLQGEYELSRAWKKLFVRTCKVQTNFYEALYEKK